MKRSHIAAMLELFREQCTTELDLMMRYHPQLYDLMEQLIDVSRDQQLKKLDEIHDKEVMELKKKLDGLSREEMKMLAKKHKDKSELSRYVNCCTTDLCDIDLCYYSAMGFCSLILIVTWH